LPFFNKLSLLETQKVAEALATTFCRLNEINEILDTSDPLAEA